MTIILNTLTLIAAPVAGASMAQPVHAQAPYAEGQVWDHKTRPVD